MKKLAFLFLIMIILFLGGCEAKKQKEENKENIKQYVKKTIIGNWSFEEEKISIDDDYTTTIYLYNVDDWVSCASGSEQFSNSLKSNLKDDIKLKRIYFACKSSPEDKINSYIEIDDISNIKMNNYLNEIIALDSNKNKITEKYSAAVTRLKNEYKQKCKTYDYEEIFRYSDKYNGKYAKFTGQVIQVLEDGNNYSLRVNVTYDDGWYTDTLLVILPSNTIEARILENDIITLYGKLAGLYEYKSIFGQSITLPFLNAKYVEIIG